MLPIWDCVFVVTHCVNILDWLKLISRHLLSWFGNSNYTYSIYVVNELITLHDTVSHLNISIETYFFLLGVKLNNM